MKKIIIVVACILIVIIGFQVFIKQDKLVGNNLIKIGATISLTGFASPWGEYAKNGMNLAVKEINNNGGLNGKKIELIIEDDHTETKDAVSAYNKLVSLDHVDGIIGGVFDFTAQPLIPLAQTNKLPLISPANFRIPGGFELNGQSFVMMTDFSKVIRELDAYIKKEKITKLAVIHFQSTFGNEIAKTLDTVMKENGQTGILNEEYAKIGDNNFRTTIVKLKAQNTEAVFLDMVGNDPINFLVQAKQLGFSPKIISYNGILDSSVNEADKSLLENIAILNWEISSHEFTKLYKDEYSIEPTKSANKFYDAVYVIANSIANSADSSKVATYMTNNSFVTPNSTVKFTNNHTVESIPVKIQIIKNGVPVKYK